MFTRKDYLDGNCTHSEYYSQFVTDYVYGLIIGTFDIEELREARFGSSFYQIPLSRWDALAEKVPHHIFKRFNDSYSLAGAVCVLKQGARQIVDSLPKALDNS